MGFWSNTFLNKYRQEIMRSIIKAEFRIGSTWHAGNINSKKIVGESVEIIVAFPYPPAGNATIAEVRLIDQNGDIAGSKAENIIKTGSQGIMCKFELNLKEV